MSEMAHTIIQSDVGHTITQTEESTTIEQTSPHTTIEVTELVLPGEPTAGGTTDHGMLTGLADDDHPQYLLETLPEVDGEGITVAGDAGGSLVVEEDAFNAGDFNLVYRNPASGSLLYFRDDGDGLIYADADLFIQGDGTLSLFSPGGVDFVASTLRDVADPTAGNHVGDRDYNDARYPRSTTIRHIVTITQAAYDLLAPPAADTLYVING